MVEPAATWATVSRFAKSAPNNQVSIAVMIFFTLKGLWG
jgi:hypothetical protein